MLVYGWGAVEPGVARRAGGALRRALPAGRHLRPDRGDHCHRFWPAVGGRSTGAAGPRTNYVGIPNPLLASTVVDLDGTRLLGTPGVPGEAVYRSPAVTSGYYRDRAATEEAFRGGWFHSGDSCVVDEDGLRIMVDRYKDIIKSGGENVSSIRVEAVLHEHPQVAQGRRGRPAARALGRGGHRRRRPRARRDA